ncbi:MULTISPECIES: class I fructose-bisphosphate aldolase [Pseudonocardia]|uniref:fructose-bisphosphate aldolase n=2 Tax=Pseudonocardia TaxID=1847 RepID=A0A1Y2MHB1_PSEAH|nr:MULTISPECIES: class I fructose-bisphosphate aldolase [Pseudonocardia]OSY34646.1 Fructose-bisphosphate aldolase class-I [Pseudonocardia autotrophica]TDN76420.1 fructose-bisphosphate aldolase class I [Pseudonocardia autotrophica]BBG00414.1 putative fructose-bisphosphate aldolase class 1 [Pseudonocardia autotrophica]GEC29502.1 putative fructose-bisphosphate aldolase class 1 [Pseudonocardia saturnea]
MNPCSQIAEKLVAPGKGILAADESIGTMNSRLDKAGVPGTAENRQVYRELLAATPGLADGASGIIFCDETLNQTFADGTPFARAVLALGILPGIKVDTGARPCPGLPGETITEGLDGLPARLSGYADLGAAFAKWRAVYTITPQLPSPGAIRANAHALARYAAACQEAGIVPIVEPEVLMDGDHGLDRCAEVTTAVHAAVREELALLNVDLAGIVLKPNMVIEGSGNPETSTPEEVAAATVAVLRAWPDQLAGVAFLSGGQPPERATANLEAMQHHRTSWPLSFSFGRALVDPALAAWHGDADLVAAGQAALADRVAANAAAVRLRSQLQPAS